MLCSIASETPGQCSYIVSFKVREDCITDAGAMYPRHQDGVRQHVRASDPERAMRGLDSSGQEADALQVTRATLPVGGLCAEVGGFRG